MQRTPEIRYGLLCAIIYFAGILTPFSVRAQYEVQAGKSIAVKGQFLYNYKFATDLDDRVYIYTISPANAACITIDFRLKFTSDSTDFIKVFPGTDTSKTPLLTLGGSNKTQLATFSQKSLTIVYRRNGSNVKSHWEVLWVGRDAAWCAKENNPGCSQFFPICGPTYDENSMPRIKPANRLETAGTGCLSQENSTRTFRFRIVKDGFLSFAVIPSFDPETDLDWMLWRSDPNHPGACPDLAHDEGLAACNFASGLGMAGSTGMASWGSGTNAGSGDSPYAAPIEVKAGETYFLLVDEYQGEKDGLVIKFNDVVEQCGGGETMELIYVYEQVFEDRYPENNYLFSRHLVEQVNLTGEGNAGLDACEGSAAAGWIPSNQRKDKYVKIPELNQPGIVPAILNAVKAGKISALDPAGGWDQLTWGDIVNMLDQLQRGDSILNPRRIDLNATVENDGERDWWNPSASAIEPLCHRLEFICRETTNFSGKVTTTILFLRLIWEGTSPGDEAVCFALIPYADIAPMLDLIPLPNEHNDQNSISVKDFLNMHQYQVAAKYSGTPDHYPQTAPTLPLLKWR